MVADRLSIKTLIAVVLAVSALAASPLQAAECIYAGLNGGAPEGQRGVAAIDADTLSVVGIIPTGGVGGATIAIDRARLRAYLSAGLGIVVADLRTNSVVDTIALPTGLRLAYQLLLSPDGLILYVLVGNTLLVVDTVSRVVSIAPVDLVANNGTPLMDITPDGKFLYVARQYHGLSVVDTTTFEIVANVSGFPPGAFAYSVVIAPDGRRAYTVDPGNMVSVIDTGTNAVVDRIQIRDCRRIHDVDQNCGTVSVAISPDGQRLYAVNSTDGSIEILDTTTFREVGIIREILDPELLMNDIVAVVHPVFAALSPDGQLLAATHSYFEDFNLLPQPNLIWVTRGFVPQRVWFSDSPVPVFSERALAIASVPSGCAGRSTCAGDCDGSRTVTVDELVRGVNMALGTASDPDCFSFDADADGRVTVDELLRAVDHALSGCPVPTPTPSPTPTGTSTPTNTPTITPTPTPTGCGALPPQVTAVSAGDCHDPTALLTGTAVALGPSMTVRVCGDLGCSTTDLPAAFPMTYPFSLRVGLVEDRINKLEACALNLACGDVACTHRDTNGNPLWVSGPTPFPCQLTPTPTPS